MVQTKPHSVYDEVFTLSASALQDVCLCSITAYLPILTTSSQDDDHANLKLNFTQNISLPNNVAEKMLEQFSKDGAIRNETLSLFENTSKYNLKVLKLPEIDMASSGKQLLEYSSFNFRELDLGCTLALNRWSMKKLKKSFSGSQYSLTYLKINLYPAVNISAGTIFDFFVHFPNLKSLYYDSPISNNAEAFTNNNWDRLLTTCTLLKVLSINAHGSSKDTELDSRLFLKSVNLESLSLYSLLKSDVAIESIGCIIHFLDLQKLIHLDLSVDVDPQDSSVIELNFEEQETHTTILAGYVNSFLEASEDKLPLLESIDLSGIYNLLDPKIQFFLDTHPALKFIGLCMLRSKFSVNAEAGSYYPNLKISGCFLEEQIVISLLKYAMRMTYMKEVLKGLFTVSSGWDKRRPYILKIVLDVMERFKGYMQLQMAATACVFHLAKEPDGTKPELSEYMLSEIARVTSMVLVLYCGNLQMVKNCLLIICTDRILHSASFDRVAMSRLCLNCMLSYQETVDRHITRMAVAIVSILACKISSKDTSNLMQEREMKLLLDIVERRLSMNTVDGTLKFDLSALWNLTDESPQACKLFVDLDGLNKYFRLLQTFEGDMHIETKVLGLLNNIAEVEFLHDVMLLDGDLMDRVRVLISNEQVQVSYFACGIIANLALQWDKVRTVLQPLEKKDLLQKLGVAIERWGELKTEIVTYRSFKPFFGLLKCEDKPQIQRWAIWAIHHVCLLGAHHYKDLMSDDCLVLLENIRVSSTDDVRVQCEQIYNAVQKWPKIHDVSP